MDKLEAEGQAAFEGADSVFCCLGTTRPVGEGCACRCWVEAAAVLAGCAMPLKGDATAALCSKHSIAHAALYASPRAGCDSYYTHRLPACLPEACLLRVCAVPVSTQTAGSAEAFRKVDLHYVEAAARAAAACK